MISNRKKILIIFSVYMKNIFTKIQGNLKNSLVQSTKFHINNYSAKPILVITNLVIDSHWISIKCIILTYKFKRKTYLPVY